MTKKKSQLSSELATCLQQRLQSFRDVLAKRFVRIHKAALRRKVNHVEFEITAANIFLEVIVCEWGELGLAASEAALFDNEDLPDADSIPWDKYWAAGLDPWRTVAVELTRLIVEQWNQVCYGSIRVMVSQHGKEIVL